MEGDSKEAFVKGPFVGFFYSLLKSPCPRGLIRGGRLICKNDFLGGAYSRRGGGLIRAWGLFEDLR